MCVAREGSTEGLDLLDSWAIETQVSGARAAWQVSLAECHGSLLTAAWRKLARQRGVSGKKQAKLALTACVLAKNSVVRRHGV